MTEVTEVHFHVRLHRERKSSLSLEFALRDLAVGTVCESNPVCSMTHALIPSRYHAACLPSSTLAWSESTENTEFLLDDLGKRRTY